MKKRHIVILAIVILIIFLTLLFLFIYKNNYLTNLFRGEDKKSTENLIYALEPTIDIYNMKETDNSKIIGGLYSFIDGKYDKRKHIKDITENELNSIMKILDTSEHFLGILCFATLPDYIIQYNDESNGYIDIRIGENSILVTNEGNRNNYAYYGTYTVYSEEGIDSLLHILNESLKPSPELSVLDIEKLYEPPVLHINYTYEAVLGSYTWKNENGEVIVSDSKKTPHEYNTLFKEEVWSSHGPILSTNSVNQRLTKLPATAIITYFVIKNDKVVMKKTAERMVDGSYHMDVANVDGVYIGGEYIYMIDLTFKDNPDLKATYYFRYKL